jgi:hypothetical protein
MSANLHMKLTLNPLILIIDYHILLGFAPLVIHDQRPNQIN